MTPPSPRPACRRHKLSTIAILNDVRNMMGWVPLSSDSAEEQYYDGKAAAAVTTILWHPEGKCKLFPPTLVTPNHL